jgi:branched-subunit amino acid transport protein
MTLWIAIIAIGLLTFATRLSLIAALGRVTIPPGVARALRLVPVAVLSAIILPALVLANGTPALTLHNTRLVAGALAVVVAWTTRNALLTIATGMVALWVLQAVVR